MADDTRSEGEIFADFLNGQLAAKANPLAGILAGEFPADSTAVQPSAGGDPAADFAAFLNGQLNGGAPDPGPIDREAKLAELADRYRFYPSDVELLDGIPDDQLEAKAARLSELIGPDGQRRPRPDHAQGRSAETASRMHFRRQGLEGFREALRDAVMRSDGQGAWSEI
jgi:hypothetical protein